MDPDQTKPESDQQDEDWGIDPDFAQPEEFFGWGSEEMMNDPMLKDAPGCILYDPQTNQYKALHPFKQSNKIIKEEFVDLAFLKDYISTSLTEDGGVVKYTDPSQPVVEPELIQDITNNKKGKKGAEDPNLPPEVGARVRIRYEGRKDNGELLDKIRDRNTLKAFKLNNDDVFPGIDKATASLLKGETCWFKFMPEYHYGEEGVPHLVEPGAVLYYKIELVDFTNPTKVLDNNDYEGRVLLLEECREKGNEAFAKGDYDKAYKEYRKGSETVKNLPKTLAAILTEEQKEVLKEFQIKTANNASLVCIKKQLFKEGLEYADIVLKKDPTNYKALFRKGLCLLEFGDLEEAKECFVSSLKSDDESKAECERYIAKCDKKLKNRQLNEKRRFEHVFKNIIAEEEKEILEKKANEKLERKKERELLRREENFLPSGEIVKKVKLDVADENSSVIKPLLQGAGKTDTIVNGNNITEELISPLRS